MKKKRLSKAGRDVRVVLVSEPDQAPVRDKERKCSSSRQVRMRRWVAKIPEVYQKEHKLMTELKK